MVVFITFSYNLVVVKVAISQMIILLSIVAFVTINLLITLWLRYHNGNDGWLQVYRRKGGKVVEGG